MFGRSSVASSSRWRRRMVCIGVKWGECSKSTYSYKEAPLRIRRRRRKEVCLRARSREHSRVRSRRRRQVCARDCASAFPRVSRKCCAETRRDETRRDDTCWADHLSAGPFVLHLFILYTRKCAITVQCSQWTSVESVNTAFVLCIKHNDGAAEEELSSVGRDCPMPTVQRTREWTFCWSIRFLIAGHNTSYRPPCWET